MKYSVTLAAKETGITLKQRRDVSESAENLKVCILILMLGFLLTLLTFLLTEELIANRTTQKKQLGVSVSGVLSYNLQLQDEANKDCGIS